MAKKLTFERAFVRHAALAISSKDGAKTVRVAFTMSWTQKIRDALGWSEIQAGEEAVDLAGELSILSMKLEVASKSYDLHSGILKNFRVVRVEDGKKATTELRCQYITHASAIAGIVEGYVEHSSRAKGELRIQYEHVAVNDSDDESQAELEGMEDE